MAAESFGNHTGRFCSALVSAHAISNQIHCAEGRIKSAHAVLVLLALSSLAYRAYTYGEHFRRLIGFVFVHQIICAS
jgi:hypothetical protein